MGIAVRFRIGEDLAAFIDKAEAFFPVDPPAFQGYDPETRVAESFLAYFSFCHFFPSLDV
jgi:hypothetical protein